MTDPKPSLRGWKRLEELLENAAFNKAVEKVRLNKLHYHDLIYEFKLPSNYNKVIKEYINNNNLDESLIEPMVSVVSDYDKTVEPSSDPHKSWNVLKSVPNGVYLMLNGDVTQPELRKFIDDNWSKLIAPRLERLSSKVGKRPKLNYSRYPKKDRKIYEAYLNRKENNKKLTDIAEEFNIYVSKIYTIIKRQNPPK